MAFSPELFTFLSDLAANNDRAWFTGHKAVYESRVKQDAFDFIAAIGPGMAAISPHVRCDERALFRIYRDTRFAKDKTPYKTHVGLHFRHEGAGDVHTPGFYLHLEPTGCWFGAGIWQPDPPTLTRLRQRMLDDVAGWQAVAGAVSGFSWETESLKRPPRGVAEDHPLVEALKRKSLVLTAPIPREEVLSDDFDAGFLERCRAAAPLMADVCHTLQLAW